MTSKLSAFAASLETETTFFEAFARACESTDFPELAAAASAHAEALRARHALALIEPAPKPKPVKAPKPKASKPAARKRWRVTHR